MGIPRGGLPAASRNRVLCLLFSVIVSVSGAAGQLLTDEQVNLLLAFKAAAGLSDKGWNVSAPRNCSSWSRIKCNATSGEITTMYFDDGSIPVLPDMITQFTSVTYLSITRAKTPSTIDDRLSALKTMTQLRYLSLGSNWFYATIPPWLVQMPRLQYLHMPYNLLSGSIPPITSPLASLDITSNLLSGTFPAPSSPKAAVKTCLSTLNCLSDTSACAAGVGQQRADVGDGYCEEAVVGDVCRPVPEAGQTWKDKVTLQCTSSNNIVGTDSLGTSFDTPIDTSIDTPTDTPTTAPLGGVDESTPTDGGYGGASATPDKRSTKGAKNNKAKGSAKRCSCKACKASEVCVNLSIANICNVRCMKNLFKRK